MEFLLISFILFTFFFRLSSPVLPSETILDVTEILSDSGYLEMSLTLQLVSQTLISQSSPITVFAPCDEVFKGTGQPHLNLLHYHIIPAKFSLDVLRSLPFGTEIPTLFENHTLTVTTTSSDRDISLNNVTINGSAIFDVGAVVVYGINQFFDLNFANSPTSTLKVRNSSEHLGRVATQFANYSEIVNKLLHTHYSSIGDFLDLQSLGFGDKTKLTIFVPDKNLSELHDENIFRRHVVPIRLTRQDLVDIEGAVIPTILKGFNLKLSKSGDVVALNGVPVFFPEVYSGKRVVIYCIENLLELNDQQGLEGDSFSGFHSNNTKTVVDHGCGGGLYCDTRTTIFAIAQVLLLALAWGLAYVYKHHQQLLLLGNNWECVRNFLQGFYSRYTIIVFMVVFECINFVIEFLLGNTVEGWYITIPATIISLYLTFSLYHYHPLSLAYKLFDLALLVITLEWTIYLRTSDFVGEPVCKIMEIIGPWVFLLSLSFHFAEALYLFQQLQDENGEPIGTLFACSLFVPAILVLAFAIPLAFLNTFAWETGSKPDEG